MTASLLPNAKLSFSDINGDPLVGGTVWFTVPATDTAKDTWQDAAQMILNDNPLTLDARGEAVVWGTGTYRQRVYDIDGDLVWDQVTSIITLDSLNAMARDFSNRTASLPSSAVSFLQSGAGAVTQTAQDKLRGVEVLPEDFGAVGDGATNDYTAFVAWAARGGIQPLGMSQKIYALSSASLGAGGIPLPSGTTINGAGMYASQIRVTGTTACNVFVAADKDNISITGVGFLGNNQGVGETTGSAIIWTAGTADRENFLVSRCYFENFRGWYWIQGSTIADSVKLFRPEVSNCVFQSRTGNAQDGGSVAVRADAITFFGTAGGGKVRSGKIIGNTLYGDYIKCLWSIWQGSEFFEVSGNTGYNVGISGEISNDAGAYFGLIYDGSGDANPPTAHTLTGERVYGVRSCGIFAVNPLNIAYNDIYVEGQTDTEDDTLPKGALAMVGGNNITAHNIRTGPCALGLSIGSVQADASYTFTDLKLNQCGQAVTFSSTMQQRQMTFDGFEAIGEGGGFVMTLTGSSGIDRFSLTNFNINTTEPGFRTESTGTPTATYWNISNGSFGGEMLLTNNLTFPLEISNVTLEGSSDIFADLTNCTKLNIQNVTCIGDPGTACFAFGENGAGQMEGVTFVDMTDTKYVTSDSVMGRTIPTWTGATSDHVQRLNKTVAGSGGSQRITQGWTYASGVWYEDRTLTGT